MAMSCGSSKVIIVGPSQSEPSHSKISYDQVCRRERSSFIVEGKERELTTSETAADKEERL